VLTPDGPQRFRVSQKLLAPQRAQTLAENAAFATSDAAADGLHESEEWMLECAIDLSEPIPDGERLLELVRIGV
jgi:hypothetical protein